MRAIVAALVVALAGIVTLVATRGESPKATETALTAPTSATSTVPASTTTSTKSKPKATSKTKTKATSKPSSNSKAGDETATPAGVAPPPVDGDAPRSDHGPFKVARAKGPTVAVQLATPAGVDDDLAPLTGRPAFAADQRGTQPLPRLEQPVQGRFATEGGYRFDNPQPFGDQLTFLVVQRSGDWLRVQLPVRPNGTMGWVKAADVELSEVGSHVEVNVAERSLRLFNGATLVAEAPVAVGVDATRTPTGRHFLTDKHSEAAGAQKAPWSLGISAYSEQLDTFDGGAPQIALHGWRDSSVFGTARSNGCIRAPGDVIAQIAALPVGTPIDVYAN